jgi:esterase/lipase superfamily enzyme
MKQTAVEWLVEQYYDSEGKLTRQDFEKAKEMELEMIHKAYMAGAKDVQELIQKQAIEEIGRLNSEG